MYGSDCLNLKKVDTFGIVPKSVNFFQVKTEGSLGCMAYL